MILALASSLAMPSAGADLLTLPEALRRVAESSLGAAQARLSVASSREDTLQLRTRYGPLVTLEGGRSVLDNEPAFRNGDIIFPAAQKLSWHYRLEARFLLWDGGRREADLAGSRERTRAADLGGAQAVRRAQAEAVALYARLLTTKGRRRVVAQRREALQEHLRTVRNLFTQGVVARNDLLRTEVSLRSVEDVDRALDDALAEGIERLNVAMGLDPSTAHDLPEELPPPPPLPWDEARCREMGALRGGEVPAREASVRALEAAVLARRKESLPSFVAEVAHAYDENRYMLYPYVNSLFLGFSVSVFDGGVRASRTRQVQLELEGSRRELVEARRTAEATAAQALREFHQALREAVTARANVVASEENLRIVEDQYREGLARNADVLDAEEVLAESRFALAEREATAYARQAALLASLGQDLEAFYAGAPSAPPTEEP